MRLLVWTRIIGVTIYSNSAPNWLNGTVHL
jgi:hypothetical protein